MAFVSPGKSSQPAQDFEKVRLTKIRAQDNAVTVTYDGNEYTIPLDDEYGIEFDFTNQKVACYSR